jgi:hypothetical protein
MRRIARERHARGEMPSWFKPAWLDLEEAPTNTYWRAHGLRHYQQDSTWLGDSAPSTSGGGGSEGGGGGGGSSGRGRGAWWWWREEDPYWPLRDWGDHPMRWWTLGFAGLLAAGGLGVAAWHGSGEAAYVGLGAGAALALCGAAMSDMQHGALGHLAVKAAFGKGRACGERAGHGAAGGHVHAMLPGEPCCGRAEPWRVHACAAQCRRQRRARSRPERGCLSVRRPPMPLRPPRLLHAATCALLAAREYYCGWRHKRSRRLRRPHLEGCGLTAVVMCALYMWTGMSGLAQYSLPTNPGEAFKMADVATKSKVWDAWGYSGVEMR